MAGAARLGDPTSHPGIVAQCFAGSVLINGRPAAAAGDIHVCALPPTAGPHPPSPFVGGSGTVFVGGRSAMRWGDQAACGALIALGSFDVIIGG